MDNFSVVFSKDTGNAENYRIPSVVVTKDGTLVAAADERFFTGSDNPNRIDKVVRISADGGKTWSEQITAVQMVGKDKKHSAAAIDPAMLYDAEQDAELAVFLPALLGKAFEYPVFVDVEDKSLTGIGKAALTRLAKRYMDTLSQNGFAPGWYSYTNFINSYLNAAELADYPLWVADYRASLWYSGQYAMWQYTSSGSVPGISGAVDLNRDYHRFCDAAAEQPTEQGTIQLVTVGPLTAEEASKVAILTGKMLLGDDRYRLLQADSTHFVAVMTVSNGDALQVLQLAQKEGWDKRELYQSRFVG